MTTSKNWPFPKNGVPVPWTKAQIAEYQRKLIEQAQEALV